MTAADREKARKQSTALRELLLAWDSEFKVPDSVPIGPFRIVAERRRENTLQPFVNGLTPEHIPDPQAVQQSADEFSAWCRQVSALAKDFPLSRKVLTPAEARQLCDRWPGTGESAIFWQEQVLAPAGPLDAMLKQDVQRLDRLATISASSSWADLRDWAVDPNARAEVVLAAWARLKDPAIKAPATWPANVEDLRVDARLRMNLLNAIASSDVVADPSSDGAVQKSARDYWRLAENKAAKNDLVAAAVAFGTAMDAAEGLDAPAVFTLALYRARSARKPATPPGATRPSAPSWRALTGLIRRIVSPSAP